MFRLRQLVVLLLTASSVVCAQEHDACLRRTVAVSVIDRDGNLIPNLTTENFRARMEGQAIRVAAVKEAATAGRVLILLDSSGSMLEPAAGWNVALMVVRQFIQDAPTGTALALAHHTTKIEEVVGFEQPREAILKKLKDLQERREHLPRKPARRTAVADVLVEASRQFGPVQAGDTILAITDGGSSDDRKSDSNARDALIGSGVRFFAVFLPTLYWEQGSLAGNRRASSPARTRIAPWDADGITRFQALALQSGGHSFTLLPNLFGKYDLAEVNALVPGADSRYPPKVSLERLWRQAVTFYRVEFELSAGIPKAKKWRLEVVQASGKRKKDVFAHFPSQLAACPLKN